VFALIDGNNFYASCERVFGQPEPLSWRVLADCTVWLVA
jgi:hypothetical protein